MIKDIFNRFIYKVPSTPNHVQIEITNKCNLNCEMCSRNDLKVDFENMSYETFKRVVDKLKDVEEIVLVGWGEPLVHPRIFDVISYGKDKGLKVRLTTNGLLVNSRNQDRILSSGLDGITFSVDSVYGTGAGHDNPLHLKNIEALLNKRKHKTPEVCIQPIMHANREQDIYDVIEFAGRIGADKVNLGRLDLRFNKNLKRFTEAEEARVFKKAEALGNRVGVRVDMIQYAVFYGLKRAAYRALKGFLHKGDKYCLKTFDYCYVNYKGGVTPCCKLPFQELGNLLDDNETLEQIWTSKSFSNFRKNQNQHPVCKICDLWRIKLI